MSNTKTFTHLLGAAIALALSNEKGIIVGRAEYDNSEDSYYVRYVDATGCQISKWFGESELGESSEGSNSISPVEAAALPQASQHTGTAAMTGQVERDSGGLPWDARIHSSSKNKNADGSWRNRKGVDKGTLAKVEAELRSTVAAAPAAAALPPAVQSTIPLPGATIPLPAPVAVPLANPVFTNFVSFLAQHTNSPSNPTGRITDDWVKQMLTINGVANGELQNLAHNPALIPQIEAGIKTALGIA